MNSYNLLFALIILFVNVCYGAVDLSSITKLAGKGRIQDVEYNPNVDVVQDFIKDGKDSIPKLIEILDKDDILPNTNIPYWSEVRVGDLALIIIIDLFTDSSWEKSTIPNMSWNEFLEVPKNSPLTAEQHLRNFIQKNGRGVIKHKWENAWQKYKERIFWDDSENCFNIRPPK